ncbi:hypothetical protein LguiB_012627 [Lonicera macranthoides]
MCELNRKGRISQFLPVRVTGRLPLPEPVGGLLVYLAGELPTPVIDILVHLQSKTAERNIMRGPCCRSSNERKGGAEQAAGLATPALRPVVRQPGPPAAMLAAPDARPGAPARAAANAAGQDGAPRELQENVQTSIQDVSPLLHHLRSSYNELVELQLENHLKLVKMPATNFILKSSSMSDLINSKSDSAINRMFQQIGFLRVQMLDKGKLYSSSEAEPVEMSEEDAACTFCYCILKVGNNMFLRKCNCQRERPILAHEECTNNNPQPNEPCSQCNEPIQNIPMTLDRAPVPRNIMRGFDNFDTNHIWLDRFGVFNSEFPSGHLGRHLKEEEEEDDDDDDDDDDENGAQSQVVLVVVLVLVEELVNTRHSSQLSYSLCLSLHLSAKKLHMGSGVERKGDRTVEEKGNEVIQCLKHVELKGWPEIKSLPVHLQHLSALTYLELCYFDGLEALPE